VGLVKSIPYAIVAILTITFSIPLTAFGANLNSMNMFLHENTNDIFDSTLEQNEQPIALVTNNRSFKIQVTWEPTEIKPNQIVRFDIKFINYVTNQPVSSVYYDFAVTKDQQTIKELRSSFAMNGMATHTVEFPSSGSFSVMVNVVGIGESAEINEGIAFDLKVVPEFPLSTVIVMASIVGIMIVLTRFTAMSRRHNMT
jgi:hypothetical protein